MGLADNIYELVLIAFGKVIVSQSCSNEDTLTIL